MRSDADRTLVWPDGSIYRISRSSADTGGALLEMELELPAHGWAPHPHMHPRLSACALCRRAHYELDDLRRAIDDARPDALLVDVNAWGALAVAEAWGGPWASWCPYPLPLPSREAPPFGPGFRPARGPAGRLRDAALGPIVFGSLERIVARASTRSASASACRR